MAEDLGEKTEEATPKRLQDAREEGRVAKSTDAAGAVLLLGLTIMLFIALMPTLGGLKLFVETSLSADSPQAFLHPESMLELAAASFQYAVLIGGPLLLVAWLLAYVAHVWQIGWLFAPKAVQPKLSKLNPINGFKRIFGLQAVVKASLDTSKVAIVCAVAFLTVHSMMDRMVLLPHLDVMQALGSIGWMLFDLALRIVGVLLLLGMLDFIWQRWKFKRDMRMSRHEVKEEFKQTDGDPETKKRRRRMQQQIALQRLASDVPRADVIVTNPEHISIAIQYDEDTMIAPKVVAKGADYIALRIRHIAAQHGIPIVERKPLARALYRSVAVGQSIPPSFYQAVAEILAYVYRLSNRRPADEKTQKQRSAETQKQGGETERV